MLSASDQVRHVERLLEQSGGLLRDNAIVEVLQLDKRGLFRGTLDFRGGFQLHASILLDVAAGYPRWIRYAFHLLDPAGRCVFRYDNEAHYPLMTTFPHHKHVGPDEAPEESFQLTLHQIVEETRLAVRGW